MSPTRYILPVTLILISGLLYVLYINDAYASILASRAKNADLQAALNSGEEIRKLQTDLLSQVESISPEDRARLEKLIPPSYDEVRVIYDLNSFATRHGLVIKGPKAIIPKSEKNDRTSKIDVDFTVTAPYSTFRTFLSDMERELSLRDIQSINLSTSGGETNSLQSTVFEYHIDVLGYAYANPEPKKS